MELRDTAKIPLRQILGRAIVRGANLNQEFLDLIANAINVKVIDLYNQEEGKNSIELDTKITMDLRLEGIARTLIRHINKYRKEIRLSINNRISLYLRHLMKR